MTISRLSGDIILSLRKARIPELFLKYCGVIVISNNDTAKWRGRDPNDCDIS